MPINPNAKKSGPLKATKKSTGGQKRPATSLGLRGRRNSNNSNTNDSFERGSGPPLNFGSPFPTLFDSGLSDPRDYVGPPVARRSATPGAGASKAAASRRPPRASSALGRTAPASTSGSASRSRPPTASTSVQKASGNTSGVTENTTVSSFSGTFRSMDGTAAGRVVRDNMLIREKPLSTSATRSKSPSSQHDYNDDSSYSAMNSSGQMPLKSLETFDPHQVPPEPSAAGAASYVMLDSPRSVTACRRLGIVPRELLAVTLETAVVQMKHDGEDVADPEVVQLRYNFLCRRRQQKMQAALDERARIMGMDGNGGLGIATGSSASRQRQRSPGPDDGGSNSPDAASTMIRRQEHRLQKIVNTNASRLKQQLLHRELMERQRQQEADNRHRQQQREARQREERRQLERDKSRKDEEAQRLRAEAKELQREAAAALVERKRQEVEAKDAALRDRLAQQRLELEAVHEAKRLHNVQRRQVMREQADAALEERRERFKDRWCIFEASRDAFEMRRADERRRHALDAARRQTRIDATKERCELLLQSRIQRTEEREQRATKMLADHAEQRAYALDAKAEADREQAARREEVYQEAQQLQAARVKQLTNKIKAKDAWMQQQHEEREAEARVKHELHRQRMLDKADCVERSRRAEEASRDEREQLIEDKTERIENMRAQRAELARRQRVMREEAERSRVHIEDPTPGPSDYVTEVSGFGEAGPAWRMGLPASVLGSQQLHKSVPAANYESSPGPQRYSADKPKKGQSYSICRHDRWTTVSDVRAATPGPADYAPDVVQSPKKGVH